MRYNRSPMKDPRTVARDIPGISDVIFPQLTPGLVAYFNKMVVPCRGVEPIPFEMVESTAITRAMLFEIAVARGQQILDGIRKPDWDHCLRVATARQRRHFDAVAPEALTDSDIAAADWVGNNLVDMLEELRAQGPDERLTQSPPVPGYQWMSSGEGDFSIGTRLIEVKCTNKNFGSADYRQILMYWLLSYASSIEYDSDEWTSCVLLNPRFNHMLEISFADILALIAAGRSKVELLEEFACIVGDYNLKLISDFDL